MSTIVVVRKAGRACIAADTLGSLGDMKQQAHQLIGKNKIIQVNDSYLALVGASAHEMVLKSYFDEHAEDCNFSSREAIFNSWRKMHKVLENEYHLNPIDDREDPYHSTQILALLMNAHGIFGVYPMRSVSEYATFWAMGSGCEYALGAMLSVYNTHESVEDIATAGIRAAAEFDKSTSFPLTMHTVNLLGETPPAITMSKALAAYAM